MVTVARVEVWLAMGSMGARPLRSMASASGQSEIRERTDGMSFVMEAPARLKGHCSTDTGTRRRGDTATHGRSSGSRLAATGLPNRTKPNILIINTNLVPAMARQTDEQERRAPTAAGRGTVGAHGRLGGSLRVFHRFKPISNHRFSFIWLVLFLRVRIEGTREAICGARRQRCSCLRV